MFVCRVFKPKEFDFAASFLCMVWIKSCLRVNTNVEFSSLYWDNLGIVAVLAAKFNSKGLKSL